MPAAPSLDQHDIRLLAVLQEDATLSINEMAERINLSPNACWKRVKRLEAEGYILKRVALLDAQKLGAGVTVFVSVRAAEHSDQWLSDFAAAVRKLPEVVEFYRMSGDTDYLLKLQVADIAAYDLVYQKLIRSVRLSDVSSAFAMEEMKHTTCIPLPARSLGPSRPERSAWRASRTGLPQGAATAAEVGSFASSSAGALAR